jgi:hypothetical protein
LELLRGGLIVSQRSSIDELCDFSGDLHEILFFFLFDLVGLENTAPGTAVVLSAAVAARKCLADTRCLPLLSYDVTKVPSYYCFFST